MIRYIRDNMGYIWGFIELRSLRQGVTMIMQLLYRPCRSSPNQKADLGHV